jgi:alkanesulfonate monooxygenase SsuD/methylene tetrahydromethanopterin reductase-like flavin-dependent oxidoreductase (luciferase family)
MYRESGRRAGHSPEKLKVGLHSLGYVAESSKQAVEDYFPGYAKTFTRIGRERGWPPVTLKRFKEQNGPTGALMIGNPEEIAEKILSTWLWIILK